jgi:hypothetical protein
MPSLIDKILNKGSKLQPKSSPQPTSQQYQAAILEKQRRDLGYSQGTSDYVTGLQNGTATMNDPEILAKVLSGPAPKGTEEEDPLLALLASLGGGGGGGGGYNLGGELDAIAQAYQIRLDELNRQKDAGSTEITAARTAADTGIKARQADNQAESGKINQSVMDSYAAALQRSQNEAASLATELQRQGVDPSRLAPGTTQAQSYLTQTRDAQSALQQRMAQTANDSMTARNQNMDLIAQGAQGQLTNNYAAIKMQMDLQRQQQEAAAQAAAAAAAARSGGSSDPFTQAMNQLKLQDLYQKVNGIDPAGEKADPKGYLAVNGEYDTRLLSGGSMASKAALAAATAGGNVHSTLNSLLSSKDALGNEVLNDGVYDSAVGLLARSKGSQQNMAQYGESPQYQQFSSARDLLAKARSARTGANKAVKSLTFRNR